jgi:hypothetical protein
MKIIRPISVSMIAILVTGCSTTSFSPPSIDFVNSVEVRGSNRFFYKTCTPHERGTKTMVTKGGKSVEIFTPERITEDAAGATRLIDNFAFVYRCTAHQAADGRQGFEIPAFLVAAGGATAAALGAGADTAIATGAAGVILNHGKNYYDPKQKAAIIDSALDAVLCIKAESAGLSPYSLAVTSALENSVAHVAAATAGKPDGPVTTITAERQFYTLILGALLSTERVLATRLSNVGSFDPAGTIAEIEKLAAEVKARKDEATDDADQQASTLTEQAVAADSATIPAAAAAPAGATPDEQASAQQAAAVVSEANSAQAKAAPLVADTAAKKRSAAIIAETNVSLYQLQPKLQQCVVRAKI